MRAKNVCKALTQALALGLIGCWLGGCGSSDGGEEPTAAAPDPGAGTGGTGSTSGESAFQELYDQGVDRYLGVFAPMATELMADGVTTYTFDGSSNGPQCFTGNPFRMSTRDGSRSELMIFLQGGGACGEDNCNALEEAPAGIPALGILNPADPTNPTADFNVGYLPYCDGTLFMGDRDTDSTGDGLNDRQFRGVQNLSASLDVIAGAYPSPSRILLIGNSAGGFGTHSAISLVRRLYPQTPIDQINDSGIGITAPGTQQALNDYWNAGDFFPASCPSCLGQDGTLTEYHAYQMTADMNLRVGMMSTLQDAVVTTERGNVTPEFFEAELLEAMETLRTNFPDRFRSFIAAGDGHTFVLRDFNREVGGTTVKQWLTDLLREDGDWVSVSD